LYFRPHCYFSLFYWYLLYFPSSFPFITIHFSNYVGDRAGLAPNSITTRYCIGCK
jgi:hypothetical protein